MEEKKPTVVPRTKDESKEKKTDMPKAIGEVIVLPTVRLGVDGLKYFTELMGEKTASEYTSKDPVLLDDKALHQISENYYKSTKKSLVHVYSANSRKACLKPSELADVVRESGQAAQWQGWRNPIKNDEEARPDGWLITVGIPTKTKPGRDGQNPPKEEIEHYIANLYFLIGQGKSICIPIRPRGKTTAPDSTNYDRNKKTKNLVKSKKNDYEYAFGGDNAPEFLQKFGREPSLFEFLEKELNLLDETVNQLQEQNFSLENVEKDLIGVFPETDLGDKYKAAFIKGLKNPKAECLDHSEYQKKYLKIGLKATTSFWKNISKDEFTKSADEKAFKWKKIEKHHIQINDGKEKSKNVVDLIRKGDIIEASTAHPNQKTYKMMFESMKALGVKEISIDASDDKGKDEAWLEAQKRGLSVANYTPSQKFIDEHEAEIKKTSKKSKNILDMPEEGEKEEEEEGSLNRKKVSRKK